jgi:HK97 family phage major capsid protein
MTEAQLRERLANIDAALAAAVDLREAPGMTAALQRLHLDRSGVVEELNGYGAALDGFPTTRTERRTSAPDTLTTRTTRTTRGTAGPVSGFGDDDYGAAFEGYIRRGMTALPAEHAQLLHGGYDEHRDWSTGTDAAGGYAVPQLFLDKLTETMKALAAILEVANVVPTDDGAPLEWPTVDDTAVVGEIIAEAAAHNVDATTPFGTRLLGSYLYSSKIVKVSRQLLMDSRIEIAPLLARLFTKRISRQFFADATNGNGTGKPLGMLDATGGFTLGATAASATALVYNDLVSHVHTIDPEYRNANCAWMMNDLVLAAIRKLADTTNRPLITDPVNAGEPVKILGYPVYLNPHMSSTFTTGQKLALFGDFKSGYVVRRAGSPLVLRLDELYAANLQVGFLSAQRLDAKPDDLAAVKFLKLA